jgi:hypothetical protein
MTTTGRNLNQIDLMCPRYSREKLTFFLFILYENQVIN